MRWRIGLVFLGLIGTLVLPYYYILSSRQDATEQLLRRIEVLERSLGVEQVEKATLLDQIDVLRVSLSDVEERLGNCVTSVSMARRQEEEDAEFTRQQHMVIEPLPCGHEDPAKGVTMPSVYNFQKDPWKADPHPLINNFRQRTFDWHKVVPPEREITDPNWAIFVQRETRTRNLLTSAAWERTFFDKNFGTLRDQSLCRYVSDYCLIHSTKEKCLKDSFCGWSASKELCLDLNSPIFTGFESNVFEPLTTKWTSEYYWKDFESGIHHTAAQQYADAEIIKYGDNGQSSSQTGATGCKYLIEELHHKVPGATGEAVMFYHFIQEFQNMAQKVSSTDYNSHLILENRGFDQWGEWLALLSNNCPRFKQDIPADTCFVKQQAPSSNHPIKQVIKNRLSITHEPPTKPVLGRNKRFLLNMHDLIPVAVEMGVEVLILPLEDMTLHEQMSAFRSTNILMGIHGSGLTNIKFMAQGSVLVQLLPWKVQSQHSIVQSFHNYATETNAGYLEWRNDNRSNARLHPHFFGKEWKGREEEAVSQGYGLNQNDLWLRFWINQDTHFPADQFKSILQEAIKKLTVSS